MLRFALLTQHNQQPPVHLFSPLYTRAYIHEPPFRHSGQEDEIMDMTKIGHAGASGHDINNRKMIFSLMLWFCADVNKKM